MRTQLALIPLLLLPWLDGRPTACDPIAEPERGMTVEQEVFPIGFRYLRELRCALAAVVPLTVDFDAESPLANDRTEPSCDHPLVMHTAGPRRLALLMSFQI